MPVYSQQAHSAHWVPGIQAPAFTCPYKSTCCSEHSIKLMLLHWCPCLCTCVFEQADMCVVNFSQGRKHPRACRPPLHLPNAHSTALCRPLCHTPPAITPICTIHPPHHLHSDRPVRRGDEGPPGGVQGCCQGWLLRQTGHTPQAGAAHALWLVFSEALFEVVWWEGANSGNTYSHQCTGERAQPASAGIVSNLFEPLHAANLPGVC